jgi:hypothetical protein
MTKFVSGVKYVYAQVVTGLDYVSGFVAKYPKVTTLVLVAALIGNMIRK